MRITKLLALAASTLLLSGCATVFSGTTQKIKLNVVDTGNNHSLETVACTLTDSSGSHFSLPHNPGVMQINRNSGTLAVVCKKAGYKNSHMTIQDRFNPVTIVNIIFWPGLIIDGLSGAYRKYPTDFIIPMDKK